MRRHQVLLLLALVWLPLAGLRPPTRQQELRVLITARNMVERGDWMHFEFQNQPRYRKPPMPYWLAAAGYTLTDRTDQAWAARLPFLLVSLLGVLCFLSLTNESGPHTALPLLFSAGFLWYGCLAETDMPQLAGMTFALWGWKKRSGTAAGAGMAFAFLSKGPGGILLPLLTMLLAAFLEKRDWRFWLPAVTLPLAAVGFWVGFLNLDPVAKEALARELDATFRNTEHRNPLPYYFYTLPLLMLPGTVWIFRRPHTPVPPVAWIWLGVGMTLLTLTISKQQHYALMLIPPAAWILSTRISPELPVWLKPRLLGPAALMIGLTSGLTTGSITADGHHARFLNSVSSSLPEEGILHVVGINSARFDFHLGRHVDNLDSAQAALTRANPGESVVVVQKQKYWDAENSSLTPTHSADDADWIRRVYRMPASE